MRKLIFTLTFFILCIAAKAQVNKDTFGLNLPVTNGLVIYTGVVEIDGKTKDDLYKNAQQWFIDCFYAQKDVIQDKDKEDGLIFGKGIFYFSAGAGLAQNINWGSHVTIKIECKDNKYRYSFYNIVFNNYDSGNNNFDAETLLGNILGTQKWPWTKNAAKNVLKNNAEQIEKAISSLKEAMAKTTADF